MRSPDGQEKGEIRPGCLGKKGEASFGCGRTRRGLSPSRGWVLASLLGFFPLQEQLPRFPMSWLISPWMFWGQAASTPFFFPNVGKGKWREMDSGRCCGCHALLHLKCHSAHGLGHPKSQPGGATDGVPTAPTHPGCCCCQTGTSQRQPREGKFCPRPSKGKIRTSFVCILWELGSRGISRSHPHFGAGPLRGMG